MLTMVTDGPHFVIYGYNAYELWSIHVRTMGKYPLFTMVPTVVIVYVYIVFMYIYIYTHIIST